MLDDTPLQHLIGYRLALADAAARRVFQRHIGNPFELRPVEFTVLQLLLANGHATPKLLALRLHMSPPNVSVLLDRLEQRGLLHRQRSASDGRATDVLLTEPGTRLARRAQRASTTMEQAMLSALSPAEQKTLVKLLTRLSDAAAEPSKAD